MGNVSESDARVRVLDFWWMSELFSPQKVPAVTGRAARPTDLRVVEWRPGTPLPWEYLDPPERLGREERVWRHSLYVGVYELKATYEFLHRMFHEDADAYDERPTGRSACAGLVLDQEGRLLGDTAILSSALWAVGRLRSPGPRDPAWAQGFDKAQERLAKAIAEFDSERHDAADSEHPPPHDATSLVGLTAIAHECAGIADIETLASPVVVISSRAVAARHDEDGEAEIDFLNSFYLDDLRKVRDHATNGNVGPALAAYLLPEGSLALTERVDLREHPEIVDAATALAHLPRGRWPAEPDHPLSLSQQYAINTVLETLGPAAGLMGVNGPPGTGKTTMLRDLLAANVVERARRLAVLRRPEDAFLPVEDTVRWTAEGHGRTLRRLRPELTGFEMLLASANNAAVENVSVEIPARSKLAEIWRNRPGYFADIATAVLATTETRNAHDGTGADAWGLVAARLGRKAYRSRFRSAFWFDDTKADESDPAHQRMQSRLKQWASESQNNEGTHRSWADGRAAFRAAEQRVEDLIEQRRAAEERRAAVPGLVQDLEAAGTVIESLESELVTLNEQARTIAGETTSAAEAVATALERHQRHVGLRPGVWETLLSLGRASRDWRTQLQPLATDLRNRESAHDTLRANLQDKQNEVSAKETAITAARARQHAAHARLDDVRSACVQDRATYGKAYPADPSAGDERELRAPWLDPDLETARSELFLAALDLHEDLLANGGWDVVNSMRAAIDVIGGSHPADLEPDKVLAAWQFFFLVVPLVSTTFASLGRMFAGLDRESIGWLLVDEAGQTSPQYAVGGIWRARRVLSVGDPLQLQPVVTIPRKAQLDIAHHYGVAACWVPPSASVQTLADRVARYGTSLAQGEETVWVSAPLRVHRRCDDPMFTLFNRIAYGGLMISAVERNNDDPEKPDRFDSDTGPLVPPAWWLDVPAQTPGTHLQDDEIKRLHGVIQKLHDAHGIAYSEIIAISPFRSVADALDALPRTYPGMQAGTIHTVQGREAPVVILVLGGDPASPGAKAWAASSVNLVNVAVSRAQRRLYVIGDRNEWSKYNYFRDIAAAIR